VHESAVRQEALDLVERRAEFFSAAGADTLVLAAIPSTGAFEETVDLDEAAWKELFENLRRAEEVCARHGLSTVLHPHFGTVVETDEQLRRFLEGCETGLCLDTGHLVIGGSDPLEIAEKAPDRVRHVHLKDVDRGVARRLGAREIGFKEAAQEKAFRPWARATWMWRGSWRSLIARATAAGTCWSRTSWSPRSPGGGGTGERHRQELAFLETTLEGSRKTGQR
jgi:inosose dehydratase